MSELLVRPTTADADHSIVNVTPQSAGWTYVGFSVHALAPGDSVNKHFAQRETCVVVLSGKVTVTAGDQCYASIGERESVFDDLAPYAVYVPAATALQITGETRAEVALCTAPGSGTGEPRLIKPASITVQERGQGSNFRRVRDILPETETADSLLIAEVITPSGNWSSYPPHKHDTDNIPEESFLEETYYHRINPSQGFAFQRVYTDDRHIDETLCVHDGDVVLVPEGYHPVAAPHGYDVYYLNVMAGPKRTWIFKNDPEHEWIIQS